MSQRESMERIDRFIKRLDDRDIIIDPVKSDENYGYESYGILGNKKEQKVGTLGGLLSKYLALYQQGKDTNDRLLRTQLVNEALQWINKATVNGAVKPSDGIYRRYDDCLDQISRLTKEKIDLEEELQDVGADLLECEGKCKLLEKQLETERSR